VRVGLWLDAARLRDEDLTPRPRSPHGWREDLLIGQNVPEDAGDLVFRLPETPAAWQFLIDIVPVQLAAEHLSRLRGENCDVFRFCPYIVEGEGGLSG
jgi:hypothetical protein